MKIVFRRSILFGETTLQSSIGDPANTIEWDAHIECHLHDRAVCYSQGESNVSLDTQKVQSKEVILA